MANLIVTNGGIAAIRNAQATGTNAVTVTSVKLGSGKWTPTGAATNLKNIIKTYTAVAGGAVGDNIIHVEAMDASADAFTAYEVGVFLSDGTMLAVAGSNTAILTKAASAQAMLAVDIVIADASSVQFVFPSATFAVPPATTTIQGVVELATDAECLTGTDAVRAVTPHGLKVVADTKAPVSHASNATTYGKGTSSNYGHVKLSDSITGTSAAASGGIAATPKAVKDAKDSAIQVAVDADTLKLAKAGDTATGAIRSTAGKATVSGTPTEQFGGDMANTDMWRIAAGGTASGAGFLEIATADSGNEPILVRQYSSASGNSYATKVREVALLDGSGKTIFPVSVTAPQFIGNLQGTADDAKRLTTARTIKISDHDGSHVGDGVSWDASGPATLKLPATITGDLNGNAKTATSAGKATNDANGDAIHSTYLKRTGGTVTGTLVLSKTTDTQGGQASEPALKIGAVNGLHLEFDGNELMAKKDATEVSPLYLNNQGGAVFAENMRVAKGASKGSNTKHVYTDADGVLTPSTANVGGATRGIYLKDGAATAMSGTAGSTKKPAYLDGGIIKACSATVGGTATPAYMNKGELTACTPYSKAALYTADPIVLSPKNNNLKKGEYSVTGCIIGKPVLFLHSVYSGAHDGASIGIRVTDGALSGTSPDSGDYYRIGTGNRSALFIVIPTKTTVKVTFDETSDDDILYIYR